MMDYQEAIKGLKNLKSVCGAKNKKHIDAAVSAIKELLEYKKPGTLEEVQESMDKQNPEKPAEVYGIFGYIEYECRECGNTVNYMDEYCKCCGKKQDWEVLEL